MKIYTVHSTDHATPVASFRNEQEAYLCLHDTMEKVKSLESITIVSYTTDSLTYEYNVGEISIRETVSVSESILQ